ncbi:hypothetical protein CANINC_003522 [Pichia inconspicua]|uniref:C2H2-type domain-containing protein n=1 Tax=Pichia inconspicua TaxID=52247 RepID=A0A4T0WYG4_9ASCO|nr:hypothetical protein CANINC_003522 [[Candida] inconspicua]
MTSVQSPRKDTTETVPVNTAQQQQQQQQQQQNIQHRQHHPQTRQIQHQHQHQHQHQQPPDMGQALQSPSSASAPAPSSASVAESHVLEALSRLRSASADSTAPLPTSPSPPPSANSPSPVHANIPANNNNNNNTTTTTTTPEVTCFGSIPGSAETFGCGNRFPSAAQLQAHLDDVSNKCIIPYTNWYLANHEGEDVKSWQIVASAVDNITSSLNSNFTNNTNTNNTTTTTTSDSFDTAAIDPAFAESTNDDNSVNYWGTVMEKNIAAAAAAAAAAAVSSNSNLPNKITISDLVQATMKVEADEAAKSKRITKRSRIRNEPTAAPDTKRKRNIPSSSSSSTTTTNNTTSSSSSSSSSFSKSNKIFTCDFCSKKFTRKSNLDSHLITHSSEKPHPCSQCGKPFARLSDRTRHEATTHGNSKIFQCRGSNKSNSTEWGCGHFYSRADGLRKHFKSAAGKLCLQSFLSTQNNGQLQSNSHADQLQNVEAAIRNVREHCGW